MISEKCNDFFTGIGPSLAKKIPSQVISPLYYMGDRGHQSIFLEPVHYSEIDAIMKDMKNTAPGHDGITLHWQCPPLKFISLIYWTCHCRRVYFPMSLRFLMLFLYLKLMIRCSLIITDLFLYCVFCQKSSKRLCIHAWCLFWRPRKFCTINNLDSVNNTPSIWPSWFS